MSMKKILFILFLGFICLTIEVNAVTSLDINNYNFGSKWEEINFSISGYDLTPQNIFSTKDGGFIVIFSYRESGELIPGYDANWNPTGTGTPRSEHSKIVKYNSNFEKQWEKSLYELGDWDDPDPLAPTMRTELFQGVELQDGSFVFTGNMDYSYQKGIQYRIDKDGNLLHKKVFDTGISRAINPTAINNGGYIIKYLHNEGLDYEYNYVVYDSNNNVVETFPEGEEAKLNNYEFEDQNAKDLLIYSVKHSVILYNTSGTSEKEHPNGKNYIWYDEMYLFTTMSGDRVYSFASDKRNTIDIKVYDSYGNLKSTILKGASIANNNVFEDGSYFIFNDGSFMIGGKIFDANGNIILDSSSIDQNYRPDKDDLHENSGKHEYGAFSTVLKDGTLVRVQTVFNLYASDSFTYKIQYKKPISKQSEDFADLVIAGEKINTNLGLFLENDRTYISISSLCSKLGCQYKRAKIDNNILVLSFPIFDKKNKFFEGDIRYDYAKPNYVTDENYENPSFNSTNISYNYIDKGYYVVEHKVETKFYQSYLDISPYQIFSLKSPTYDANAVDVTSKVIDGEVYVPLRFVAEALGRYVTYTPGVEGGKPTITISAAGEGEFYDKFGVVVSKEKLYDGDTISNIESSSVIDLKNGKLYGYGIDKNSNTIINKTKTIFFPLAFSSQNVYSYFTDRSSNVKDNSEYYLGFYSYSGDDRLGGARYGISCKINYLWKEVTPRLDSNNEIFPILTEFPYIAISNIEGYPFLKIVYIDVKTS